MFVHVNYKADPDSADDVFEHWELDYNSLTIQEATTIETMSDLNLDDFEKKVNDGSKSAIGILVYVIRQRIDPKVTWADVADMRTAGIVLWTPKPDAAGKAPSRAKAAKTPAA